MEAKKACLTIHQDSWTNQLCCYAYGSDNFTETAEESKHFIAMMNEKVWSIDPDHIMNMDQTPTSFFFIIQKRHRTQRAPRPSMSVLLQQS
jgi:hypothetical protein